MQDFQEVIEDSQLMNAMYDETPRPVKEWFVPSPEELSTFTGHWKTNDPKKLEMGTICSNCLGFYLFTRHAREHGDPARSDFIVDVAHFRAMPAGKRAAFAQSIAQNYLLPTSRGRKDSLTARHPSHLYRINSLNRGSSSVLSVAEDTSVHANALQLTGNDVQEVLDIIGASSAELSDAIKRLANESTGGEGLVCDMSVAPLHEKAGPVEAAENAGDVTSSALFDKLDASIFSRLKNTHRQGFTHSQYYDRYIYTMIRCEKPVTYDDFVYFRTLGRGGFGLVNGCKKTESGQLYAIKQMDRKRIKKKNAANLCINERKILEKVSSPFIVCMQYAFTTPSELYIILDLMVGGDLAFHLHQKGFFTAQEVQYYTARTVLGIKALHDIGVVYRDLKPENILMDYKGRSKLSDLGLSCEVPEKGLSGAYGTRGYWAPEMLRKDERGHRVRYKFEVDWFSLGCIFYEFCTGINPFKLEVSRTYGSTRGVGKDEVDARIDKAVLEHTPSVDPAHFISPGSADMCLSLLAKDSSSRLGWNGAEEVMAHPYFRDLNWDDVINDTVPPPSVPRRDLNIGSQDEIGQFKDSSEAKKLQLTREDMDQFKEWDFVRPSAVQEEVVCFMQYEEHNVRE